MGAAPTIRAASCAACRFSALRLFASDVLPTRAHQASLRSRVTAPTSTARFSTFRATPRLAQSFAIEEQADPKEATVLKEDTTAKPETTPKEDVPWYLEVEPPIHPTLVHEAPPLPEVPEGAPRMAEPLVKFVSEELGLDDLKLLDLREMDPPPAIGPDLLMLFGTARSERHLHVSADRLVRWLRGRGITAKADGLLGRNELKTKLRRQARKAKMLGGSAAIRGEDDGISTGWICVNLGTIGSSDKETQILNEAGEVMGFGVPHTGSTIVVQIMTESRREELNLEHLWEGQLRRGLKKKEAGWGVSEEGDEKLARALTKGRF
ncbi:hypothetical protein QBC34DRAFT_392804 [Podospora aff. communis PSN243]|uniref:ATPase synthesis protein 25 n=1 Tax=Podospora aff. communis PSN243 TaxID=3040156 RepID=A0AAV9H2D1_9PEZI|nr:hypothetical protein QBC34DRAFT_392804 [Podospora aff. communis PSN243]